MNSCSEEGTPCGARKIELKFWKIHALNRGCHAEQEKIGQSPWKIHALNRGGAMQSKKK